MTQHAGRRCASVSRIPAGSRQSLSSGRISTAAQSWPPLPRRPPPAPPVVGAKPPKSTPPHGSGRTDLPALRFFARVSKWWRSRFASRSLSRHLPSPPLSPFRNFVRLERLRRKHGGVGVTDKQSTARSDAGCGSVSRVCRKGPRRSRQWRWRWHDDCVSATGSQSTPEAAAPQRHKNAATRPLPASRTDCADPQRNRCFILQPPRPAVPHSNRLTLLKRGLRAWWLAGAGGRIAFGADPDEGPLGHSRAEQRNRAADGGSVGEMVGRCLFLAAVMAVALGEMGFTCFQRSELLWTHHLPQRLVAGPCGARHRAVLHVSGGVTWRAEPTRCSRVCYPRSRCPC